MAADSFFSVTFGEIIEMGAIVIGVVGGVFGFGRKVQSIEQTVSDTRHDMTEMKEELKKLGQVVTQMAVASTRMDMFDKRLDDIVHGRVRVVRNG